MADFPLILSEVSSELPEWGVAKVVGVENSVQASTVNDGQIVVMIRQAGNSAVISLAPSEARHFARVLNLLAGEAA